MSTPMDQMYAALQQAHAAGDTAGAQQLADYIRSGAGQTVPAQPAPIDSQGYTITGAQTPNPYPQSPVWGDLRNIGADAMTGLGEFWTDIGLGTRQIAATGDKAKTAALQQEAAEKLARDAPLSATPGGQLGRVMGAAPLMLVPGVNTIGGAALLGGGLGALQPTTAGDSRLLNTGTGAALGAAGQAVGSTVGSWLTKRAAEPFMGWNTSTANRALAQGVGSTASKLDQPAINESFTRLGSIFDRARTPGAIAYLGPDTAAAVDTATSSLNRSSEAALRANDDVKDLLGGVNSALDARRLGQISSRLGNQAATEMSSQGGDRALGSALYKIQDHVDDLVGSTITDPELASAYDAARPQYRTLVNVTKNPSILNSATGQFNPTAYGKFLQKADRTGYARGQNTSDLYNAARWGQATGQGKGAPPLDLSRDLGLNQLKYYGLNNPVSRAIGGTVSRVGAPAAPYLGRAGQGLMFPLRQPISGGVGGLLGFGADSEQ